MALRPPAPYTHSTPPPLTSCSDPIAAPRYAELPCLSGSLIRTPTRTPTRMTEIFAGEPGTLLATVTVPLALPDFDGSNVTVSVDD